MMSACYVKCEAQVPPSNGAIDLNKIDAVIESDIGPKMTDDMPTSMRF